MELYVKKQFFQDKSTDNRCKYEPKFTEVHDWALVNLMQQHGLNCAAMAVKTMKMFSNMTYSAVSRRMYHLLGCSSIEGMNRVGCDAKKVQAHFQALKQALT